MKLYRLTFGAAAAMLLASGPAFGQATAPVAAPEARAASGTMLSIDQLYQPRSLIGTTPEGYAWSADGRQLLFLWNDEGYSFRDLWVYSLDSGERTRLTSLGREADPKSERRGISEALFLGNDRIAFVVDGNLHIREADGASVQVETDKRAIRRLSLSPDGQTLAFVSGNPVDPRNRVTQGGILWTRDAAAPGGNAARRLVGNDDPKIYVSDYHWSSDGRAIAFEESDDRAMPERDIYYYAKGELQNNRVIRAFPGDETSRTRIGLIALGEAAPRYFERPDPLHHLWGFGLSQDGRRLFVNSSDLEVKDHIVYVFDTQTGKRETFYRERDPKHIRPDWKVAWAPGDRGLVILTDRDGFGHLYHKPSAGAAPRRITRGEWEIESFEVDASNNRIYFVANESALPERQLYRVAMGGGAVERVSPATPGTHTPVWSPDYSRAASFFTNDTTPPELLVIDPATPAQAKQVTRSPQPEFDRQTWAKVSYVEFPSHVDGTKLIGRLSVPADFDPSRRYPLIVGSVYSDAVRNQWGGRRAHPTWGLDQYFVARGYLVLNVNIRGSWGQGRKHTQAQLNSYGETDINDLESGVRHLVSKGYVDPSRVGLWGSSYGGLMTIMSLAKKPGVYAAGIAGAPATNVWHAYPSQMWIMGPPDGRDMPARYEAQSPLYQVQGVRDPLMIIHGTRDPVVLYSDTVALTEKMIANEQMFELVTLPGASHSWATDNLPQTRFAFRKMVDFFNLHLKPER
ncbi:S9 family peptidase [Allosphingosinicella indica]|nr:prolyl oligopeptidase family serine peptidase [Allosphingosinicella indica]